MKRIILAVVIICLLFTSVSYAQWGQPDYYLGLELGFFVPSKNDYTVLGEKYKYKTGREFGLKYTYYYNENIGVIGRLSSISWDTKNTDWWYQVGNNYDGPYASGFTWSTISLAVGAAYRYQVYDDLDLIAHAGLSSQFNSVKYQEEGIPDETSKGTSFGYFIDGGIRFYVSEDFTIGWIYRYTAHSQDLKYYSHKVRNIQLGGLSVLLEAGMVF